MATKAARSREGSAGLTNYSVLIVDDQPETLAALRRLLREEAYQLVTCDTPAKALEWASENRVDLLIADERMPDMRGSDLLERVREISPETVRVILTGYPGSSTVAHGLSHSVDWLISKPWNDDALKITIRQLLEEHDRRKRPRPASESSPDPAPRSREADEADFCEQAAIPLCSIGADGTILWANRAELEFLGYSRDEYVGRSLRDFHVDPRTERPTYSSRE